MARPPYHRPPRSGRNAALRSVGGRQNKRQQVRAASPFAPGVVLGAVALFAATLVGLNRFDAAPPAAPVAGSDWQPAPSDWRADAGIVDPPAETAFGSEASSGDDAAVGDAMARDDGVTVSRGSDANDYDADGNSANGGSTGDRLSARFGLCHSGGGRNCVVDGDTFWFGGEKFRIADIDTPETHPPRCAEEAERGAAATRALHSLLNSGPFSIERQGSDRYGRTLAVITRDGQSIGGTLVGNGLARWYGGGRRSWC